MSLEVLALLLDTRHIMSLGPGKIWMWRLVAEGDIEPGVLATVTADERAD